MDDLFNLLQAGGHNSIEKIIGLFKDAKVLEADMEVKMRELFKDAPNPENISLEKFNEVMTKFAEEHEHSVEQLGDILRSGLIQLTENFEGALAQVVDNISEARTSEPRA